MKFREIVKAGIFELAPKKAQITINLTWMFALFTGFLVFALIISFINAQKESSDTVVSTSVLENIDNEIKSLSKTRNTFSRIVLPNINLKIFCDSPESSTMLLEGSATGKQIPYQSIFSSESLEGREFLTWTQDWTMPQQIDNFIYIMDLETLFIIVKDSQRHWQKFSDNLPEEFPRLIVEASELNTLTPKGYERYKVILFERTRDEVITSGWVFSLESNPDLILINPLGDDLGNVGGVEFYTTNSATQGIKHEGTSLYAGLSLVYGAAFSESFDHYRCTRDKAVFKLRVLNHINKNRAASIMESLSSGQNECLAWIPGRLSSVIPSRDCDECLIFMAPLIGHYDNVLRSLEINDADLLSESITGINQVSENLARGRNCPTL